MTTNRLRGSNRISIVVGEMILAIAMLALLFWQAPAVASAVQLTDAAPAEATKSTQLSNPLGTDNIQELLGRAARIVTGISGSFALLMFVYGGFTWVTSQGNPEKIKRGKQIFVSAVLGLLIIFGSYALLTVVFKTLSGAGA